MKLTRRSCLKTLRATVLAALPFFWVSQTFASRPDVPLSADVVVSPEGLGLLQTEEREALTADILCAQLYVKTPEEEGFVVRCVELRDKGVLPNRILYTAYRYAVKKQKSRRYQYFHTVIVRLCEERDIPL